MEHTGYPAALYPRDGLSPYALVALDWLAAFTCWDLPRLYSHFTSQTNEFQFAFRPDMPKVPGVKSMHEWKAYTRQLKAMLPDFWMEIMHIYDSPYVQSSELSPGSRIVIAQGIAHATSRTGVPFREEGIVFMHIRPEAVAQHSSPLSSTQSPAPASSPPTVLKIYKVVEFVDSRFVTSFFEEESKRWQRVLRMQAANDERISGMRWTVETGSRPPKSSPAPTERIWQAKL